VVHCAVADFTPLYTLGTSMESQQCIWYIVHESPSKLCHSCTSTKSFAIIMLH